MKKLQLISLMILLCAAALPARQLKTNVCMPRTSVAKAPLILPEDGGQLIEEQPEGTLYKDMYSQMEAYSYAGGMLLLTEEDGVITNMVESEDGTLYVYNPIMGKQTDSWMKIDKTADGQYRAYMPQLIDELDYYGTIYKYYLCNMIQEVQDEEHAVNVPDQSKGYIEYTWQDGVLTMVEGQEIGYFAVSGAWSGYGTKSQTISKVGVAQTTAPEDVEFQEVLFRHGKDRTNIHIAQLGIQGDDVYVRYEPENNYSALLKGTINGTEAEFETEQYLGPDYSIGYHTYMYTAMWNAEDDGKNTFTKTDKIVFDYDRQAGTLETEDALMIEAGSIASVLLDDYLRPRIEPYIPSTGQPQNPVFTHYHFDPTYYMGYVNVDLSNLGTDGNYIKTKDLYFNLYIDGEQYKFEKYRYKNLTEDTYDMPYEYNDHFNLYNYGVMHTIYFFTKKNTCDNIGIKLIYKPDENTCLESDIVYYNSNQTGLDDVEISDVVGVEYYDVFGRKLERPGNGVYIKISTRADGSRTTTKHIGR